VPVTFGILSSHENPRGWRDRLDLIDSTASRGGRMFGQCHAREISVLMSFRTQLPFDVLDEWRQFRSRPLDEQRKALSDRRFRDGLVHAAHHGKYSKLVGAEPRKLDFSSLFVIRNALPGAHSSVAEIALQRQVDPVDAMIDLSLETNFEQFFFQPVSNVNLDDVADILQHPRTIMTFSDSGAHVSQIMDSSIHSTFLAYWVRERQLFTLEDAVRIITLAPARAWGLHDRGLIREGMVADLNIFDPETIRPDLPQVARDLPGSGVRLTQKCSGIHATVVSGKVMLKNGEHTGLYPGKLLRGPLAGR
jgi:N-acyl-D-amino-acid deacylase